MRIIYQNEVAECGYACLAMVLSHLGRATEVRELSVFRPISSNGLSLMDLYDVAVEFGLAVQAYRFDAGADLHSIARGSILGFLMLDELLTASGALEWTLVVLAALTIVGAVVVLSRSAARHESEPSTA